MSDAVEDEHLPTFPAVLAGGSVGLVLGGVALGLATGAGSVSLVLTNTLGFVLASVLLVYPVALVIGIPVLRLLRARIEDRRTLNLALGSSSVLVALAAAAVMGTIMGSFWTAVGATFTTAVVCVVPALAFSRALSARPRLAAAIILATSALGVVAGCYFLIHFLAVSVR